MKLLSSVCLLLLSSFASSCSQNKSTILKYDYGFVKTSEELSKAAHLYDDAGKKQAFLEIANCAKARKVDNPYIKLQDGKLWCAGIGVKSETTGAVIFDPRNLFESEMFLSSDSALAGLSKGIPTYKIATMAKSDIEGKILFSIQPNPDYKKK
jgi:hypothetical protein